MYAVDLDELDATVAELARCDETLDLLLAELERRVALLHESWAGAAASAHALAHERWDAGFRAMREGLATMRAAGGLADQSYRDAASTNLRMWEQVS